MGFVFTVIYIITAYLSPNLLFGDLAQYHLEIILAALALLASLPGLSGSGIVRAPQTIAVLGMCFAVLASLVATGWLGGVPAGLYEFLPDSFAFFLVAVNCRTRARLQILIFSMIVASLFLVSQGAIALRDGLVVSRWLYDQGYEGVHIMRIRGLGLVNDPNDFGQVLISLIAFSFLLWRPRKLFWNMVAVLVPCALLLVGVFLTHSRGALLALMAVIALSVYRRFGVIPALMMAGVTFALSMALSWSGGREISVEAGEDRLEAWSTGLQLIKSHPLFGVGYRQFTEYNEITAHNTIVVCAAELGFFGFYFWVLFVVSSIREGVQLRTRRKKRTYDNLSPLSAHYGAEVLQYRTAGNPLSSPVLLAAVDRPTPANGASGSVLATDDASLSTDASVPQESEASIRQMAWVAVVGFIGFLVAGWFLSRAYVMWLFVWGGMIHSIHRMAVGRGLVPAKHETGKVLKLALWVAVGLLLFVYIILRVQRVLPH